jgi:hypothetical protein
MLAFESGKMTQADGPSFRGDEMNKVRTNVEGSQQSHSTPFWQQHVERGVCYLKTR